MIRYGVVGVGGFANTWVHALSSLETQNVGRMAAFCEIQTERYAAEIARLQAAGCLFIPSFAELLARATAWWT